jgi:hypothetical protein
MRKFNIEDIKNNKEISDIYNNINDMSLWLNTHRTNGNITTREDFITRHPNANRQMVLAYNVYSLMEWKQQQQQQQRQNIVMAMAMGNMGGRSKRKKNNKSKKRSKIFRSAHRRMKNKTKSQRRKK